MARLIETPNLPDHDGFYAELLAAHKGLAPEQSAALNAAWSGEPMPESLTELIADARLAWERALHEGLEWSATSERFIAKHPALLAEALLDAGFVGEVCVVNI